MTADGRYVLALDLQNDAELIAAYEAYHRPGGVWPAILASIRESGIRDLAIYRWGDRMVMILEAEPSFSFAAKAASDSANPDVARWEALMWRFQKALPGSLAGEKWQIMKPIFNLADHP